MVNNFLISCNHIINSDKYKAYFSKNQVLSNKYVQRTLCDGSRTPPVSFIDRLKDSKTNSHQAIINFKQLAV